MTSLLVATSQCLLRHDIDSGRTFVVENMRPAYYGVSWFGGNSYPLLTHSNLRHGDFMSAQSYMRSEIGTISQGADEHQLHLSAPHQIRCLEPPYFAVANTGRNSICIINVLDWSMRQLRFDDVLWDRYDPSGATGSHFNSFDFQDGVLHVLAHNYDKGSYSVAVRWPELRVLGRTYYAAVQLHGLWLRQDGRLLACDSSNGALMDLSRGEVIWRSPEAGYTRGFASFGDRIFVGSSPLRGMSNVDEVDSRSLLWVLQGESFATEGFIDLGNFGPVVAVRVADALDSSHPVGPLQTGPQLTGVPVETFFEAPTLIGPGSQIEPEEG